MTLKSPSSFLGQLRGLANDIHAEVLSYVPTAVGDHLTAAKREVLAAAREVINEEMRWTDKRWEAAKERKASRKTSRPSESAAATDS